MAFSPWQILSPVQWAKWTWSAVRGGGAGEDEAGGPEGDPEEEDSQAETKSLSFRQVHASLPRCRRAALHPSAAHSVCVCVVAQPRNHYHRNAASLPVAGAPLCIRKFRMFCPVFPFPRFSMSSIQNLTLYLQSFRIPVCFSHFLLSFEPRAPAPTHTQCH